MKINLIDAIASDSLVFLWNHSVALLLGPLGKARYSWE
jgi:hypothetical protein